MRRTGITGELPGGPPPKPLFDVQAAVAALDEAPGEWVALYTYSSRASARTHKKIYRKRFPQIEWATRSERDTEGRYLSSCTLYARRPV